MSLKIFSTVSKMFLNLRFLFLSISTCSMGLLRNLLYFFFKWLFIRMTKSALFFVFPQKNLLIN